MRKIECIAPRHTRTRRWSQRFLRGEKTFTERNLLLDMSLRNVFSRRLRHPPPKRKAEISTTKFQGPSPNWHSRNKGSESGNSKNQIPRSKSELPEPKQRSG